MGTIKSAVPRGSPLSLPLMQQAEVIIVVTALRRQNHPLLPAAAVDATVGRLQIGPHLLGLPLVRAPLLAHQVLLGAAVLPPTAIMVAGQGTAVSRRIGPHLHGLLLPAVAVDATVDRLRTDLHLLPAVRLLLAAAERGIVVKPQTGQQAQPGL